MPEHRRRNGRATRDETGLRVPEHRRRNGRATRDETGLRVPPAAGSEGRGREQPRGHAGVGTRVGQPQFAGLIDTGLELERLQMGLQQHHVQTETVALLAQGFGVLGEQRPCLIRQELVVAPPRRDPELHGAAPLLAPFGAPLVVEGSHHHHLLLGGDAMHLRLVAQLPDNCSDVLAAVPNPLESAGAQGGGELAEPGQAPGKLSPATPALGICAPRPHSC